jgi:hypothetical protein
LDHFTMKPFVASRKKESENFPSDSCQIKPPCFGISKKAQSME